ncbi:uncharacterized protein TRAVEDRAFT_112714, partial [Trametes versicolor FP-101664 SS1]|uniref:uncharacterized protein n=1 Tax=Trametes versicolor (strain FP-101664) TaxID=717944 RepID=UPI0004621E0B
WTPQHPKYQETMRYMRHQEFHNALDRVQQLVAQRLLELTKANMTGMGYKMRTSIGKALKARGKAIRSALNKYNRLALQMKPPAPQLLWKDVVTYTFISEFELLRHSYTDRDITSAPWTKQRNREVTSMYFKVLGARKEMQRIHVEARRLHTSIVVERLEYEAAIRTTMPTDPCLAGELTATYRSRSRIHDTLLARLRALYDLPGYTGTRTPGVPVGRGRDLVLAWQATTHKTSAHASAASDKSEPSVPGTDSLSGRHEGAMEDGEDGDLDDVHANDALNEDMVRLTETLEGLPL